MPRQRPHPRSLAAGEDLERTDAVDADLAAQRVDRALHQRVDVEVLERLLAELGHRPLALLGAGELRDVLHEALEPDGAPLRIVHDVGARLEEAQPPVGPARADPARERAAGLQRGHGVFAHRVELRPVGHLEWSLDCGVPPSDGSRPMRSSSSGA